MDAAGYKVLVEKMLHLKVVGFVYEYVEPKVLFDEPFKDATVKAFYYKVYRVREAIKICLHLDQWPFKRSMLCDWCTHMTECFMEQEAIQ